MNENNLKDLLPKLDKNRHKYQAGFVVGIGGSLGMYGAVKLAGMAALRSGAGIVKLISEKEIPNLPLELINIIEDLEDKSVIELCNIADAVFVGPGLGRKKEKAILKIIPKITSKLVIDADALFYLSLKECAIPKNSILTPHKKEMMRLLNIEKIQDEKIFLEKCQKYAEDNNVIIILKGYPTIIFHSEKEPLIIQRGDPGMATAGTGDVLTGVITALLAQKIEPYNSAVLGVFLHAMAGEKAALDKTSYSMIASDIIENISDVIRVVMHS